MKFNIHLVDELFPKGQGGQTFTYEFNVGVNLDTHTHNIVTAFRQCGIEFSRDVADYCLQTRKGRKLNKEDSLSSQLASCETNDLELIIKPHIRAQLSIELLMTKNNLKENLFHLRTQLIDHNFVEEFIRHNGMLLLFELLGETTGNTQSYCLNALRNTLSSLNGMKLMLASTELITQLYQLTYSPVVSVCRRALELLFVTCTFDKKGGEIIHQAAVGVASDRGEVVFSNLVELVASGDLDTQINCLTLINNLIQTAESEERRCQMLDHLENELRLNETLKKLTNITSEAFCHQLQFYENLTGQSILQHRSEDTKRQLKEYQLQQPMFNIMRNELQRAQHTIQEALKHVEFLPVPAVEPLQRYSERIKQIESEFSNRGAMSSEGGEGLYSEQIQKLNDEVCALKEKRDALQAENTRLNNLIKSGALRSRDSANLKEKELLEMQAQIQQAIANIQQEKEQMLTLRAKPIVKVRVEKTMRKIDITSSNSINNAASNLGIDNGEFNDTNDDDDNNNKTGTSSIGIGGEVLLQGNRVGGVGVDIEATRLIKNEFERDILEERQSMVVERQQQTQRITQLEEQIAQMHVRQMQDANLLESQKQTILLQAQQLDEVNQQKDLACANTEQLVKLIKAMKVKYDTMKSELTALQEAVQNDESSGSGSESGSDGESESDGGVEDSS